MVELFVFYFFDSGSGGRHNMETTRRQHTYAADRPPSTAAIRNDQGVFSHQQRVPSAVTSSDFLLVIPLLFSPSDVSCCSLLSLVKIKQYRVHHLSHYYSSCRQPRAHFVSQKKRNIGRSGKATPTKLVSLVQVHTVQHRFPEFNNKANIFLLPRAHTNIRTNNRQARGMVTYVLRGRVNGGGTIREAVGLPTLVIRHPLNIARASHLLYAVQAVQDLPHMLEAKDDRSKVFSSCS